MVQTKFVSINYHNMGLYTDPMEHAHNTLMKEIEGLDIISISVVEFELLGEETSLRSVAKTFLITYKH